LEPEVARRLRRTRMWRVRVLPLALLALIGAFAGALIGLKATMDWYIDADPRARFDQFVLLATHIAFPVAPVAAAALVERRLTRRLVRRYLKAPWCPNCEYPILAPPDDDDEHRICPECGEPIPPELVQMAR